MRLARLPIPVAPARHETLASYLARLATLHGLAARELWEPISTPRAGTRRRDVDVERLAAITGRDPGHLAYALPELRDPAPDWMAWRHQPQPRCPRCDARHDGGPVTRLLPHHRYVCTRHRYWIGPPDAGQRATRLGDDLVDIVHAQRDHECLVRRHGAAVAFDAVLTGFLICGHLWADPINEHTAVRRDWTRRTDTLIPIGAELATFSAARVFAAVYPEAVYLAQVIASPAWRRMASADSDQQRQLLTEIARRLGCTDHRSLEGSNAITHWMKFDASRPPSRPEKTFPETRDHGASRSAKPSQQALDRRDRSAVWFAANRRGSNVILHHRHIRPVLIRDWSPRMDGITATIYASQTTLTLGYQQRPSEVDQVAGIVGIRAAVDTEFAT